MCNLLNICLGIRKWLGSIVHPPGSTPLDWPLILTLYIALFSSAIGITILFPFLPSMVKSFGYSEEHVGYYAGFIASSMFIGRAVGAYFWGWLGDKIGRRIVALISLVLCSVANIMFGFSTSLVWAITTRFLLGLFNGLVPLVKTVISEVCDDTNQSLAMTVVINAWSTGLILGPALGGYLSEPANKYPDVFKDTLFDRFAYLLPCVPAGLAGFLAFIAAYFNLKETLKSKQTQRSKDCLIQECKSDSQNKERETNASSPTLSLTSSDIQSGLTTSLESSPERTSNSKHTHQNGQLLENIETTPQPHDTIPAASQSQNIAGNSLKYDEIDRKLLHSNDTSTTVVKFRKTSSREECDRGGSLQELDIELHVEERTFSKSSRLSNLRCCKGPSCSWVKDSVFLKLIRTKEVSLTIGLYGIVSFGIIGLEELFSVWAATDVSLGGLSYSTDQIGSILLTVAASSIVIQLIVYPKLERRLGCIKTFQYGTFVLIFTTTVIPIINSLAGRSTVVWSLLLLVYLPRNIACACCFLSVSIIINNSAPPEYIASVNGIAMTFTSITRSLAPVVGGSLYAWSISSGLGFPFDEHLTFIFLAAIMWVSLVLSTVLPMSLNRQKEVAVAV